MTDMSICSYEDYLDLQAKYSEEDGWIGKNYIYILFVHEIAGATEDFDEHGYMNPEDNPDYYGAYETAEQARVDYDKLNSEAVDIFIMRYDEESNEYTMIKSHWGTGIID